MKSCACGCGEPAIYAARHVTTMMRNGIVARDYAVMDCGHETACWIWKGRRAGSYANVRVGGHQTSAHRAMYAQEIGAIPIGAVVDHLCGERRCVNPAHLVAATIGDNVRRSVGFNPSPEDREEILTFGATNAVLAAKHGVSERTISNLRRRHRDRHAAHPD